MKTNEIKKGNGKRIMKKVAALTLISALGISMLAGCGKTDSNDSGETDGKDAASDFAGKNITVVSREDGSGTRGAFIELVGLEEEDASGNKVDTTTAAAEITNSTSVMMTSVSSNDTAIGYISLGSLDNSVKALSVDGVAPSIETVKDGSYKISRPFNIATKDEVSEVAQDFINYILSDDGQAVVEESGYISESSTGAFSGSSPSGKIVVAGSSSVTPVMEKLKEAYLAVNPNAEIEVQQSDSTTGMNSAVEGICDIGMASRDLKDSEKEKGLSSTAIALDGIAVVVNNNNPLTEITTDNLMNVYKGNITSWGDLLK